MLSEETRRFVETEQNLSMEFVTQALEYGQGIYLYGAGHYLRYAVQFMQKYKIAVKAILDTHRDGEYRGIPIIRFSEFMKSKPNQDSWFVISAPSAAQGIREVLQKNFPKENIFSFEMVIYCNFIPDFEEYRKYLLSHWQEFSDFSETLADDKSRETLEAVIRGRVSGNVEHFQHCYVPDQYYPTDIIHFTDSEVMVELGASNGETLLDFTRRCPNFKAAYCFEPDKACISQVNKIVETVRGGGDNQYYSQRSVGLRRCTGVLQ